MKRTLVILSVTACSFAFTSDSLAQGRAPGAGRGLSNAARGVSHAGPAIAGANAAASHVAAPAGSAAGSMSRSASGLERSGSAIDRALPTQAGRAISGQPHGGRAMSGQGMSGMGPMTPERIAQHRADQANHLRSVSARNGNERLMQTADRMDGGADANYQRQIARMPETVNEGQITEVAPAAARAATAGGASNAKRGFWIRSR